MARELRIPVHVLKVRGVFSDELQSETIDMFSLPSKVKAIYTVYHLREMMPISKLLGKEQRKLAKN